jgi:uncharacterized OB-fold protein
MMNPIEKWRGEIPLKSQYTAGVAGQKFFAALKLRGELLATRCPACNQVYLPARLFCERCYAELSEEVSVKPQGIVRSFTVCYVGQDGQRLDQPYALALIELDGATTLLLHRVLDIDDPSKISIGTRVELLLKPASERLGSILDIEGFRVLKPI